jgi:hypothetical protein
LAQIRIRRLAGVLAGTLALACGAAVAARGDDGPLRITKPPSLTGTAQVGGELQAVGAQWTGPDDTTVTWRWVRCLDQRHCRIVDDADTSAYDPQNADLGWQLLAWLRVSAGHRHDDAFTPLSDPVQPAPPPPPKPKPAPTPAPTPAPAPAAPAAPPPVAKPAAPRMMRPFPLVRIRGRLTATGVRLTLVTVRAPRGARVTINCRGRGCPARRQARTAVVLRMRRFEGALRAGDRLRVTVSKRGYITKVTTIRIRRGRVPLRLDECRYPGAKRTVACPA